MKSNPLEILKICHYRKLSTESVSFGRDFFSRSAVNALKPFLTAYQTRESVILFLNDDIYAISRETRKRYAL